jgi:putative colanic acid biosynthesis glycosyltransferase
LIFTIISIHLNNYQGFQSTYSSLNALFSSNVPFKWIIKDGCSDPNVWTQIKQELKEHNENTILISEKDNGVYDAMNLAINLVAPNEIVLFLNCGDQLNSEFINRISAKDLDNFDFIYSDTLLKDSTQKFIAPENIDFAYLVGKTINHQSFMIKSDILKKFPFDTDYSIVADWVQLMEIFRNEKLKIKKLNFPISIYEGGGISEQQDDLRIIQRAAYLKACYSQWELDSIIKISRMRQRPWFDFIIDAIESPKRSWILKQLSHIWR